MAEIAGVGRVMLLGHYPHWVSAPGTVLGKVKMSGFQESIDHTEYLV